MTTRRQMQQTVLERLFWHTAERDDATVADHLFCRREMSSVFTLDEATLFDFFFQYLRKVQVFPLLEDITPKDQQREHIPFIQFLMLDFGQIMLPPRRYPATD